jgi:hypothetical protein
MNQRKREKKKRLIRGYRERQSDRQTERRD